MKIFVIAEMSANHNQKLSQAIEIIKAVKKSGADAIKLQTYTADTITIDSDKENFKVKGGLWDGYYLYELYKKLQLLGSGILNYSELLKKRVWFVLVLLLIIQQSIFSNL
jgi:sialic acid synthase SpsE